MKTASLKARLTKAEERQTPRNIEVSFIVVDKNGDETGEGMIVRPNKATEFYQYTPPKKEAKK